MAYDGIEVEIKIKVDDSDASALSDRLRSLGASEKRQVDHYYDRVDGSFIATRPIKEWLSIRERGGRAIVNHKLFHFGADGLATHCDELDVAVDDSDSAAELLRALGFSPLVVVDKRRIEHLVDRRFLVSVDTVMGLGSYVEIEAADAHGSVEETGAALRTFATEELGLSLDLVDHKGYPHLLIEQQTSEP